MKSKFKISLAVLAVGCFVALVATTISAQNSQAINSGSCQVSNSQGADILACGGACKGKKSEKPEDKSVIQSSNLNLACGCSKPKEEKPVKDKSVISIENQSALVAGCCSKGKEKEKKPIYDNV